jgi:hypothetical protein
MAAEAAASVECGGVCHEAAVVRAVPHTARIMAMEGR